MFITFEGPDGSGKSTQAELLAGTLRGRGLHVLHTREPGGTELGNRLREIILDPASPAATPLAMALLYSASRAQLVETIIQPALSGGKVVVADRYVDSTTAYQAYGLGVPIEYVRALGRIATGGLRPDISIYVDIEPEVGVQRTASRGRRDRLDARELEFHRRVRDGYIEIMGAEPERWVCIDGSGRPEAVQAAIMEAIEPRLVR